MAKPVTTFGQIRGELSKIYENRKTSEKREQKWFSLIDDSQPTRIVEYAWGTPLPDEGENAPDQREIGVILSGEAEVCEEHWLTPWGDDNEKELYAWPCAYRPIKHLEEGDIFGDFVLLDEAAFKQSVVSRPFEKWNVVFGGRSAIFLGTVTKDKDKNKIEDFGTAHKRPIQDYFEDAEHKRALHHLIDDVMSKCRTRVAYIKWHSENDLDAFLGGIFLASWRRAYTYRLASNSYNIRHKFVFLGRARKALKTLSNDAGTKVTHAYTDRVNYDEIAPVFMEAIYDALNRPIRDEPVFACIPFNSDHTDLAAVLTCGRIGRPARISRHPDIDEFFFPIGLSNFIICNYANSMQQMEAFYEGIGVKGFRRPSKGSHSREYHAKNGGNKGSGLHFWKTAADLIIASHVTADPESDKREHYARSSIEDQYTLSCEVLPSFDGRLELYVKYARK